MLRDTTLRWLVAMDRTGAHSTMPNAQDQRRAGALADASGIQLPSAVS